jgi:hypothetical protein
MALSSVGGSRSDVDDSRSSVLVIAAAVLAIALAVLAIPLAVLPIAAAVLPIALAMLAITLAVLAIALAMSAERASGAWRLWWEVGDGYRGIYAMKPGGKMVYFIMYAALAPHCICHAHAYVQPQACSGCGLGVGFCEREGKDWGLVWCNSGNGMVLQGATVEEWGRYGVTQAKGWCDRVRLWRSGDGMV